MDMNEKELKELGRRELLELLLLQTRRTEELETNLEETRRKYEKLEAKLEEAERKLNDRALALSDAGSIAEAAIRVNSVFESAEAAAKQYLDNIKECSDRSDRMMAYTKFRCEEMEKKAMEKVMTLKSEIDELHMKWKDLGSVASDTIATDLGNDLKP